MSTTIRLTSAFWLAVAVQKLAPIQLAVIPSAHDHVAIRLDIRRNGIVVRRDVTADARARGLFAA